ncbi:MAG: hypothetical protein KGZ63_02670 [Clostridiales bacterium]|jgi:predicted CXXCH cytochrome family protein|nr:hypothetical protein [Clostridiales bacterium]
MTRTWVVAGLFIALLAGFVYRIAFRPDPTPPNGNGQVAQAEFVGQDACRTCHGEIYEPFLATLHPRKVGPANQIRPEALETWNELAEDRGNPVVFNEDEPTGMAEPRNLELAGDITLNDIIGVFVRHESDFDFVANFHNIDDEVVHSIAVFPYHIGDKYRQAFAVNLGEGEGHRLLKYQFAIADYDGTTLAFKDRNQARIYEVNCIGCHVSGLNLAKWEANKNLPLEEFTANLGVGCESCHGPGSLHVANPARENSIVNPEKLTKDQQVHNCSQCHIRGKSTNRPERQDNIDFRPGDNVLANFAPVDVQWGEGTDRVAADGKAKASRQQFMDLYIGTKADMTCTQCHSVHQRNEEGILLKTDIVSLCAQCHGDRWPTPEDVRSAMNGQRGWEDEPEFSGWRIQHTFRYDEQERVIGLPEDEWPEENRWPWEFDNWTWDFE